MTKPYREQIRIDELTNLLVDELMREMWPSKNKISKSEIYRSAVHRMARQELSEETFSRVLQKVIDCESL